MEELKVGERVTLEVIEQNVCNGCDGCFFGHDDICYNPTYNGWGDEGGSWWEVNRVPDFYKDKFKQSDDTKANMEV